jgi:hypothetical protein
MVVGGVANVVLVVVAVAADLLLCLLLLFFFYANGMHPLSYLSLFASFQRSRFRFAKL